MANQERRAFNKKNGMEDMKKAEWYIKKYNELTKEEK